MATGTARGGIVVGSPAAVPSGAQHREKANIPTEIDSEHIYCLDRKVVAGAESKRLGPMGRRKAT